MLVKAGTPHLNIFEQQDAEEIFVYILDEFCGDFILALDWVQVKVRVTIICLSCHQSIDNEDSFTIFQLPVANTVQFSVDLFLTPEHLSGDNSFFSNYYSSLQPAIIEHCFSRIGQFLIIQLKRFVNFQGTVTKDINMVKCFANISIPVILDNDIVKQKKFTLISTVNRSGILNNRPLYCSFRNNLSPAWYHCSGAAVISCSEEVLESNTSFILFYKTV